MKILDESELRKNLREFGFKPENTVCLKLAGCGIRLSFCLGAYDEHGRLWQLDHPGPRSRFPVGIEVL